MAEVIDQVEPFHESISALGCELPPREGMTPPTAQQLQAFAHVVSMNRLDCDGSVFGLVTIFQPDGVVAGAGLAPATEASAARMAARPSHVKIRRLVEVAISQVSVKFPTT